MTAIAPDPVTLSEVTGAFGARGVSNEAENVIDAYAALDQAAQHGPGYDTPQLGLPTPVI